MIVYMLKSISCPKEIYFGVTGNLKVRLRQHNSGASLFTKKFMPWKIKWALWLNDDDKIKVYKLEKYFKSHSGRAFVQKHF